MSTVLKTILTTLFLLLIAPMGANAMSGMFSAKYIDGPNIITLTHNMHETQSGVPITFNVRLYNMEGAPLSFGKVTVAIKQDSDTLTEQSITQSEGGDASLQYTFARQGSYVLHVTFLENDKQIAKGEFPLTVAKGQQQNFFAELFTAQTLIAFLAGAGVSYLVVVRKRLRLPALKKMIAVKKTK